MKPQTGTLAISEDPFDEGLHCLLRQNQSTDRDIQYVLEIITCDPSIYIIDHPDLIVSSFMENFFWS